MTTQKHISSYELAQHIIRLFKAANEPLSDAQELLLNGALAAWFDLLAQTTEKP